MEFKTPKEEENVEPIRNVQVDNATSLHCQPLVDKKDVEIWYEDAKERMKVEEREMAESKPQLRNKERNEGGSGETGNESTESRVECHSPKLEIDVEDLYNEAKRRMEEEEGEKRESAQPNRRLRSQTLKVRVGGGTANKTTAKPPNSTRKGPASLHLVGAVKRCPHCSRAFAAPIQIQVHIRACRSREKEFECLDCPSSFSNKRSLADHKARVHQAPQFTCDQCGKSFRRREDLCVHIMTHSGEKPFKCFECDAHFTRKGHLTAHMRTHSGEKPFVCVNCSACFCQSQELSRHMKSHHDPSASFSCSQCCCAFLSMQGLSKHLNNSHSP